VGEKVMKRKKQKGKKAGNKDPFLPLF